MTRIHFVKSLLVAACLLLGVGATGAAASEGDVNNNNSHDSGWYGNNDYGSRDSYGSYYGSRGSDGNDGYGRGGDWSNNDNGSYDDESWDSGYSHDGNAYDSSDRWSNDNGYGDNSDATWDNGSGWDNHNRYSAGSDCDRNNTASWYDSGNDRWRYSDGGNWNGNDGQRWLAYANTDHAQWYPRGTSNKGWSSNCNSGPHYSSWNGNNGGYGNTNDWQDQYWCDSSSGGRGYDNSNNPYNDPLYHWGWSIEGR